MQITTLFKSSPIPKALFIGLLCQVQAAWAAQCTTAPECVQNGTTGFVGGTLTSVSIQPGVPNPTSFDTTRFTSTSGYELWVTRDIKGLGSDTAFGLLEKMFFDGDSANNAQRMDVTFFSSITDGGRLIKDSGEARLLQTSQLNLNYVNFETKPSLHFFGTDNQINLIDSRVKFNTTQQFLSTAPLTINVNDPLGNGTESSFFNFSGNIFPTSTTINIENGNTLTFEDSGRVFASVNSERLNFGTPVIGNVNNGTLKIDNSNVYFNSTSFGFTNGSTLNTVGSDSSVEFRAVLFDNSLMDLGNNTSVTARDLNLEGTYISLGSGAKINASLVRVSGGGFPTTLSGGRNNAGIDADGFIIVSGATFQQEGSSRVNVARDLVLLPDATLSINEDSVFIASTIVGTPDLAKTSTVDINTGGTFFLTRGLSNIGRNIAFDVDGTSFLRVGSNGLLSLGFPYGRNAAGEPVTVTNRGEISVQNDGQIDIDGKFSGNGTIAGSGKFLINNSGQIAPGPDGFFGTETITFENAFEFTNTGTSRNRSRYVVDVDVVGGTPRSDLLQYDDQGFDITRLESIEVNTASAKTADELNGQVFTIISSLDAGSTGTLVTGSYPAIVEGGDVPALIDFTVFNNSTNGKDDVTLQADKDIGNLLKHPSVVRTHRAQTTTTSQPVPGNPNQTATTVTQIIPQTNGTASQLVTITTTDNSSGAILSTSTSTSTLGQATGSQNKTAASSLLFSAYNTGNADINSSLNSLSNNQVSSHVESIHPEPYSSYMTVSLEHSDLIMNTVLNHAAPSGFVNAGNSRELENKQTGNRSWMDVSYLEGDVDASGDLGNFTYSLSSLTIGHNLIDSGKQTLGMYFSFGTQKMDEHDTAIQDFDSEMYHLGFYLSQLNVGDWDVRGLFGYSYGDNNSKRHVRLGNTSAAPSASYSSHSAYVGVKADVIGYENSWMTLSPELGFSYIYHARESFSESGDPSLSLALDLADAQAIIASAGLNARFASFFDSMSLYPLGYIRYEHDFYANANNEHDIDAALVINPEYKQTFVGQNRGENAMITGIGLGSSLSSALQVSGGFVHTINSHGSEWGGGINLEYQW